MHTHTHSAPSVSPLPICISVFCPDLLIEQSGFNYGICLKIVCSFFLLVNRSVGWRRKQTRWHLRRRRSDRKNRCWTWEWTFKVWSFSGPLAPSLLGPVTGPTPTTGLLGASGFETVLIQQNSNFPGGCVLALLSCTRRDCFHLSKNLRVAKFTI